MAWTETQIQKVWKKGTIVPNYDKNKYRKDKCGAWMVRSMHGDATTQLSFGWEIDHIYPESLGGEDNIENLQPLQWENNRHKGDDLTPNCKVTSKDKKNIYTGK